jgi:hypothetical protein
VFSFIADLFKEAAVRFLGRYTPPQVATSLPYWVSILPYVLTLMVVLLSVLYSTEAGERTLKDVDLIRTLLQAIKPHVEDTHHLVGQKAVVQEIDPTNVVQFEGIFGDARTICAYNPPLSLLTNRGNPHFRNVIFDFLSNNNHSYRMIVGPEGDQRLAELYTIWATQHGVKAPALQAFARLRITLYTHKEKLHTEIKTWPVFRGNDLRGLSFFLIETPTCRRVLLYILGDPFVKDFVVPDLGLLISEPLDHDESRIFERLRPVFDRRWGALEANGTYPNVVADQPLPEFVRGRSARIGFISPTTEV